MTARILTVVLVTLLVLGAAAIERWAPNSRFLHVVVFVLGALAGALAALN